MEGYLVDTDGQQQERSLGVPTGSTTVMSWTQFERGKII